MENTSVTTAPAGVFK